MKRSLVLIKGNMISGVVKFLGGFMGCYGFAGLVFELGVVDDLILGTGRTAKRIAIGVSFLLLFFMLVSVPLVQHIRFYFACKEYHSEIIDKQLMAKHLEGYLGGGGGGGGEIQMEEETIPV